jgi:predicted CoA-binding protein
MYDTDVMVFETRASAENYKNKWDPDPYYINPKEYEIVPVTPKYKKEVAGYERRR